MSYESGSLAEMKPRPYQKSKTLSPGSEKNCCRELDPMSPVAILVCAPTPPHAPFFVSENISTVLDYEPEEIVRNPSFWMNTVHTEDTPQLLSGFFHLFTRGHHVYDYRFLRKDGACKRLLVELHLHRRRKKEPIAMMGFLREPVVTDGKISGDGKAGADLFSDDDGARLTIDSRQRIRKASPRMEEVCGRSPDSLIGRPALELIPPDYAHLANDVFSRIVHHGHKIIRFWQAIQHSDGSLRFVSAECTGSNDDSGERTMVMKCRDITGLITLDPKSRIRCTTRLLWALSRDAGVPDRAETFEPLDRLTGREREILYLTIEGLSSTQIGERLSISPRTAEAHRAHIMNKLGVHSLSQLIRYTVSCIAYPESA
jgi:PAS domain S-box-containing protein